MHKIFMVVGIALCFVGVASIVYADSMASRMAGKILLQVEENGEAWYVSPDNNQRYFLGRPNDAFELMRKLGLGISNSNLNQIPVASDSPVVPTEDSGQTDNQASSQEVEKAWKVTHVFSGKQDITTEPFVFTDGSWVKIKYSFIPIETSSYYSVSMQSNSDFFDQDLIYNEIIYPNMDINSLSDYTVVEDTTNLYNKKVNTPYHFEISADGGWVIEVMEYLRK